MRFARAIDLWLGELERAGRQPGTLDSYRRHLNKLVDHLKRQADVGVREVDTNDCRAFLSHWTGKEASTICTILSAVNGLFE